MQASPRPVVLVAEDHPVNQKVMGLVLSMLGVEAEMVNNGREAVEAAEPSRYSLILMDIMMPEMDGFQASYEIRKREFTRSRHTPIIACTALDRDKVREQCIRSGIDDYMAKPISREVLQEKIESWSHIPIHRQAASLEMELQVKRLKGELTEDAEPINGPTLKMLYGLEQLDDILALFLTVTETLLAQLESAIQHKDSAVVRRTAHEIKGSSYAVNAKEMSRLSLSLEKAGEEQNWNEAERLYASLGLAFGRVREFVQAKSKFLTELGEAS